MSSYQAGLFLLILGSVTARTLFFKSVAARVSPNFTAWAIGSGTFLFTVTMLPLAYRAGLVNSSSIFAWQGAVSGVTKGVLLTVLLVAQQKLIANSLSATTYVFPVAIGLIGVLDVFAFGGLVTFGAMFSIAALALAGIAFSLFGHLKTLDAASKAMFATMVAAVVGFACCDRIGIPIIGWYPYLIYTGLGNMLSALFLCKRVPTINWLPWVCIAAVWSLPELLFNYAISSSIPISYGYLAISLRVPILMLIALAFFKEGKPTSQIFFGLFSLIASVPAFF